MENLNLEIGQKLTIDELGKKLGFEAGELVETSDIVQNCSADNYNEEEEKGINVEFKFLQKEGYVYEWVIEITDIYEI